jgi:hypothetical protein
MGHSQWRGERWGSTTTRRSSTCSWVGTFITCSRVTSQAHNAAVEGNSLPARKHNAFMEPSHTAHNTHTHAIHPGGTTQHTAGGGCVAGEGGPGPRAYTHRYSLCRYRNSRRSGSRSSLSTVCPVSMSGYSRNMNFLRRPAHRPRAAPQRRHGPAPHAAPQHVAHTRHSRVTAAVRPRALKQAPAMGRQGPQPRRKARTPPTPVAHPRTRPVSWHLQQRPQRLLQPLQLSRQEARYKHRGASRDWRA